MYMFPVPKMKLFSKSITPLFAIISLILIHRCHVYYCGITNAISHLSSFFDWFASFVFKLLSCLIALFHSVFGRKKTWKLFVSVLQQASFRLLRILHLFQLMVSEERYKLYQSCRYLLLLGSGQFCIYKLLWQNSVSET